MIQNLKTEPSTIHTPARQGNACWTILLVEDDRTSREMLSAYLKNAGYRVQEARNGEQAWEYLSGEQQAIHLVVTDRLMPGMDGMALFSRLKKEPRLRHIPVIMQTGASQPNEVAEGIQAGVFYYLTKPYEEPALLAVVQSALRAQEQQKLFYNRLHEKSQVATLMQRGVFRLRQIEEAQDLAFLLGSMFPRAELAVMGLYELMLNAVEHGLLGIGYDLKASLLANSAWHSEIEKRSQSVRDIHVTVSFQQTPDEIRVTVNDPGPGFEWRNYLQIEPSRATKPNGRGIAKANLLSFDALHYNEKGNSVEVVTHRDA